MLPRPTYFLHARLTHTTIVDHPKKVYAALLAAVGVLMEGLAVQIRQFLFRRNSKGTVLQRTQDGSLRNMSETRLVLSCSMPTHQLCRALQCRKRDLFRVTCSACTSNIQHSSLWLMYTAIRPHCQSFVMHST